MQDETKQATSTGTTVTSLGSWFSTLIQPLVQVWYPPTDTWKISVSILQKHMDQVTFEKLRPLLDLIPKSQNFSYVWTLDKSSKLVVLPTHPRGKHPEFPYSLYQQLKESPIADDQGKVCCLYFDETQTYQLTTACPSLKTHFEFVKLC